MTPAAVHERAIVIDTHDDTTQRLLSDKKFDIGVRQANGNIDIPRMREGGLDALFFSIWVPSDVTGPIAVKRAMQLIDSVHEAVRSHPNDLMLATTAADIRRAASEKKIAALMGMEGGHMIDDDLGTLRDFAKLGVRYLTLTHFKNNNWADSSTDKPKHHGLTDFGKDVVRELNRLGVMVDISHVADKTFEDVLALTTVPVIASHSSCRAIANHPRNMTDDMMRALAKNGGVMMINFEVSFLSEENRVASEKSGGVVAALDKMSKLCGGNEACSTLEIRADHARGHGQGHPALGVVGEDRGAHRPRGQGGGRRPRGPRLRFRRRHHAHRHGRRLAVAEAHHGTHGQGLLGRRRGEDSGRQHPARDGASGAGRQAQLTRAVDGVRSRVYKSKLCI